MKSTLYERPEETGSSLQNFAIREKGPRRFETTMASQWATVDN
jgi:hypothetical protein